MTAFHVRRAGRIVTAGHDTLSDAKRTARTYLQTNPAGDGFGEPVDVVDAAGATVGTWTADRGGKGAWTLQADAQMVRRFLVDYLAWARRDRGSPDAVLRLRTGWPDRRINAALRTLGLVTDAGLWIQGWTDRVETNDRIQREKA